MNRGKSRFRSPSFLARWIVAGLAVLCLPLAAQGATQTYDIPYAGLVNMPNTCGTNSYYSNCSSSPIPGFTWTDTIAAGSTINSVSFQFIYGIECVSGTFSYQTKLNTTNGGTFSGVYDCYCIPTAKSISVTLPASAYQVGMANTAWVYDSSGTVGPSSCWGAYASGLLGAGIYGKVTVDYTAGGGPPPAGDPWPTQLPGAYAAGTAGRIVGANLDAALSTRATQASVNAVSTFVTANLNVPVSTRASQASIDAIAAKLNAVSDAVLRGKIEDGLAMGCPGNSGHNYRISTYYLPEANNGHLLLVRTIVADTITKNQASGLDTNLANEYLARGDTAAAAGDYRGAWDQYKMAYAEAVY